MPETTQDLTDITVFDTARSADGTGNASDNAGAAHETLIRLTDAAYADGVSAMSGEDGPSAREISNVVLAQSDSMPDPGGASDFLWAWGQFLDHDLSLTEAGESEAADIAVPLGDPFFDPFFTGATSIGFHRVDPADGSGVTAPRSYTNEITAFMDASQIYGSSAEAIAAMRVEGGKLRMVEDMLVVDGAGFLTGDIRAAENPALSSLHTLFTREHNRIVDEFAEADPDLSDDQLFEAARARVEAITQAITFNEFLPKIIGADTMGAYEGYDPSVNPSISVEFSTMAFRFGHTLISATLERSNEDGSTYVGGDLALRDAFFNVGAVLESGIDPFLRGLAGNQAETLDAQIIDDLRSFLFGPPGAGGFDLASLNIQRGRDLGLGTYNEIRAGLGLDVATSFGDITTDAGLAARLETVYGSVDLVDAWVGGLAEDSVAGGMVGELFATVIADQFARLRAGDAYWSEGRGFAEGELDALWSTSLSDVILRNTDVEYLQDDIFTAYTRIGGTADKDKLYGDAGQDLILGFAGRDKLHGRDGDDELYGGEGSDLVSGGAGDDRVFGEDGNDKLNGNKGDDALFGGNGADLLKGNRGDDLLDGGLGEDTLYGGLDDDILSGGLGNDKLLGGKGHDILDGGQGDDMLTGGRGGDLFVFRQHDAGTDIVTDYDLQDSLSFDGPAQGFELAESGGGGQTLTLTLGVSSFVVFADVSEAETDAILAAAGLDLVIA